MWPEEKREIFKEEAFIPFDEQAKSLKKMFENLEDIKKVIVGYVKEKDLTVTEVRELSRFVGSLAEPASSRDERRIITKEEIEREKRQALIWSLISLVVSILVLIAQIIIAIKRSGH